MDHTSSSAGGGFSFGPLSGGGAIANDSAQTSINRFVSRNYVLSALSPGAGQLIIQTYSENNNQDVQAIKDRLLTFVLAQLDKVQAKFQQKSDKTYDLVNAVTGDALGLNMSVKDIAIASKGDANFDSQTERSVSYGQLSATDKNKLGISNKSDVTFAPQGNLLIPSTVDLYAYNQSRFDQHVRAYYSQDDIKFVRMAVQSPGDQQFTEASTNLPREVGTITASVIPLGKAVL